VGVLNDRLTAGYGNVNFTIIEYCDGLPLACNGNGPCNTSYHPPICACNPSFTGRLCENCKELFYGPSCLACPECGLNGTCNDGIQANGLCVCNSGFYGNNCRKCPACVNGYCEDSQSGSGKCHCTFWWAGELCDSRLRMYIGVGGVGVITIILLLFSVVVFRKCRARKPEEEALLTN